MQDVAAAIAHDFIQPDAAIDRDEKRSFVDPRRLGVRGDVWIDQMIPNFQNLALGLPSVDAQVGQNAGHDRAGMPGAFGSGNFHRGQINPAPFSENVLSRRGFARPAFEI